MVEETGKSRKPLFAPERLVFVRTGKVLPTGSVKVECSPPERKVVCSSHSRVIPLKNGNRYTQLSTKLESAIDKPERWLSSGQMLCERLLCPNGELNALGPPMQDLH